MSGPHILEHAEWWSAVEVATHDHGHVGGWVLGRHLVTDGLEASEAHGGLEEPDMVGGGAEVQVSVACNQDLTGIIEALKHNSLKKILLLKNVSIFL